MNTLVLRSISGLVYILLFLGAIYVPREEVFFMWCALLGIGAALEIRGMFRLPRQLVFVSSSVTLILAYMSESKTLFIYAGVLATLLMSITLLKKCKNNYFHRYFSPLYAVLGIFNLFLIYQLNAMWCLGILLLVWTNDSMAYLVGSKIGKTKVSSISPNKSLEGYLGGTLATVLVGYFLNQYLPLPHWLILSITTSLLANLGDLVASKMKRLTHVKDSGRVIPGHGGILDRIDSLIYLSPVIYLLLTL